MDVLPVHRRADGLEPDPVAVAEMAKMAGPCCLRQNCQSLFADAVVEAADYLRLMTTSAVLPTIRRSTQPVHDPPGGTIMVWVKIAVLERITSGVAVVLTMRTSTRWGVEHAPRHRSNHDAASHRTQ